MSTNVEEFIKKLETGDLKAGSTYGLRNESLRAGSFSRKIQKVKTDVGKVSKLLFLKELVFQFNPQTGEEDENFNAAREWRPPLVPSTSALIVKKYAHDNEKAKERIMKEAQVENWDVSDPSVLTEEDKKVLSPFLKVRTFSRPVVYVNAKEITGQDYSKPYTISIKRDELGRWLDDNGNVTDEKPRWMQLVEMTSALQFREYSDFVACREKELRGEPYELKKMRPIYEGRTLASFKDDDLKDVRSAIYGDIPLSADSVQHAYIVFEVEMKDIGTVAEAKNIRVGGEKFWDSSQKILNSNKKIRDLLKKFEKGQPLHKSDRHFDYIEVDRVCPTEYNGPEDKKAMLLGKDTEYSATSQPLHQFEIEEGVEDSIDGKKLIQEFLDYTDQQGDLEPRFLTSAEIPEFSQVILEQIEDYVYGLNLLESPFMTKQILQAHKNILSAIYDDKFADRLMEAEENLIDLEEGNKEELEESIKAAKEVANSKEIADDGSVVEREEEEVIQVSSVNVHDLDE